MNNAANIKAISKIIFYRVFPVLSCLFLLILSIIPQPLAYTNLISIQMTTIAVFYWSIYLPKSLPMSALFIIGVIQDILFGLPLGISSLSLICIYFYISIRRTYFFEKKFYVHWLVFSLISLSSTTLTWLIISAINGNIFQIMPIIFQNIITISFYPCVAWLLGKTLNTTQ